MNNNLFNAFLFPLILGGEFGDFDSIDEMLIASDDNIQKLKFSICLEVMELIDKGYSEEQIYDLIENVKFDKEYNLNVKEEEYLKKSASKTLKKIKNRFKEKENDLYE